MTGDLRLGPSSEPVTPKEAEKRAYALLRFLVPAENWGELPTCAVYNCNCVNAIYNEACCAHGKIEYIDVTGSKTGAIYRILMNSAVSNVVVIAAPDGGRRVGNAWCAAPDLFNDWMTNPPKPGHRANHMTCAWEMPRIPLSDLFLGQYLTIKYNEELFIRKAL